MAKNKLVCGVGINDGGFPSYETINGKRSMNPFYRKWASMLERCYSTYDKEKHRTYDECYVCEEWLSLKSFKEWMEQQDWQGKELDKDLLVKGNKVYSPDTCIFISHQLNTFVVDCGSARGRYPLGVSYHSLSGKFNAKCRNPFNGKRESLGYFACMHQAHEAWRVRKHELACQLAEVQEDDRLNKALRMRYA